MTLWRCTGSVVLGGLFWMALIAWVMSYLFQYKVRGRFLALLGIASNVLVISVNGGVMPVVGIPSTFLPWGKVWDISGNGRWLMLADQASLHRFSVGDIMLIAGCCICTVDVLSRMYPLVKQRLVDSFGGSMRSLRVLWTEEVGQDIAEYAVMLAVILVIVVGTIRMIGSNANTVFSQVSSSIQQ